MTAIHESNTIDKESTSKDRIIKRVDSDSSKVDDINVVDANST